MTVLEDPVDDAIWFVETSAFNAFGGTALMMLSSYGAEQNLTRLGAGLRVAEELKLHTDVTAL